MKIDQYSLKARIYPSFIVLLPILLLAVFYVTNFEIYFHYLTAFATIGLFSYLLSQIGRDLGKTKEQKLFKLTSFLIKLNENDLFWQIFFFIEKTLLG